MTFLRRMTGWVARGVSGARDAALAGVSRLCLEAIAVWSRIRGARPRALPRIPFRFRPLRPAPVVAAPAAPPSRADRMLGATLDAAIFGVTVYVVILVHREVYAQMRELPSHQVRLQDVRLVQRPAWAPQETVTVTLPMDAKLAELARGCAPGLVPEVGRRLENNPWVRRVIQVRRVYPDRVQARIELRRPAACVTAGAGSAAGRAVFVDDDGVRLPDFRSGAPLPIGCTEIAGVDGAPPPVGTRWMHPGVQSGLEVMKVLDAYDVDRVLLVARIDVSNAGGRRSPRESEVVLWTAAGVPVAWGRPPSTNQYGENPPLVKMQHLALALESFPGLRGLERVDLRFDRVVVRPRPEWRGLVAADAPVRSRPRR